jgi:hypothetical protein
MQRDIERLTWHALKRNRYPKQVEIDDLIQEAWVVVVQMGATHMTVDIARKITAACTKWIRLTPNTTLWLTRRPYMYPVSNQIKTGEERIVPRVNLKPRKRNPHVCAECGVEYEHFAANTKYCSRRCKMDVKNRLRREQRAVR